MRISITLLFLLGLFLKAETTSCQVTFQQIPGLAFFESQGYLNGVSWVDVDNDDGFANLSDATANHPNIFPTQTSGSNSNAIIWVDYNRDGWLDLSITQPDALPDRFFENEKTTCRSWLEIKCIGIESNHAAIGATVRTQTLRNGMPWWQMRQVSAQTAATGTNPMLLHFGFDGAAEIDSLLVEWPSGNTCVFTKVGVNQILDIKEDCTIKVTQAAPPLPGTSQTAALCLPSDTLLQLQLPSPPVSAGGTWTASCGPCISASGVFDYLLKNGVAGHEKGDVTLLR